MPALRLFWQPMCWPLLIAVSMVLPSGELSAEETDLGSRTLTLIRHGDYDHEDTRDPRVGRGLIPLGVAQARLVGARLRAEPFAPTGFVASTMRRARETAEVIAEDLPDLDLALDPLLEECTPPTWREDILADETPEAVAACRDRLEQAYERYVRPSADATARHDVIVAHGNVIRYFVTRALGVDPMSWLGMSIANCSITEIVVLPDGSKKVLSFSDAGHIPPYLRTRTPPGPDRDLEVPRTEVSPVDE